MQLPRPYVKGFDALHASGASIALQMRSSYATRSCRRNTCVPDQSRTHVLQTLWGISPFTGECPKDKGGANYWPSIAFSSSIHHCSGNAFPDVWLW